MKARSSYHQERLWFIDQFETGKLYEKNPIYHNIPLVLEMTGDLQLNFLENSITEVIRRHEVLRTSILTEDDIPLQCITDEIDFQLEIRDGEQSISDALQMGLQFNKKPFSLEGKLIRGLLIKINEIKYMLVLSIHYMICDDYSLDIITKDLISIYQGFLQNHTPELPKLPFQYVAFSEWQKNLPDDVLENHIFYWKRKLNGRLQPLDLPTYKKRNPVHTYYCGQNYFEISADLNSRLNQLCYEHRLKKREVLLAAWNILLQKYCNLEEILIGTTLLNRTQKELANIVGPIENLVVLRNHIDPKNSFLQVLAVVKKTLAEAEQYKDIPFDKLVSEMRPELDMSRTAFFDVLFKYELNPKLVYQMENVEFKRVETNLGWGKYDLNVLFQDRNNTIHGVLNYNQNYYQSATISRMIEHYINLLVQIVTQSTEAICTLSLLSPEEQVDLLNAQLENMKYKYPDDLLIHKYFEEQVIKHPDKIAVVCGEEKITYQQLNAKANQIAHFLKNKGVQPNTIVGLLLEPSIIMISAILGVLKAGGGYLPIDYIYPDKRIELMIEDSGLNVLITSQGITKRFPAIKSLILIESPEIWEMPTMNLKYNNTPEDTAYVIYTSGTTGRPKGAILSHCNVTRLILKSDHLFDFSHNDVWTMFHSYSFDLSVWEMFGSLLTGSKLVVISKIIAQSSDQFLKILAEERVTILNQTPTAFYVLLNTLQLQEESIDLALRYVIFGGEALKPVKLKDWREKYQNVKLINMYGITETTIHATFKEITEQEIDTNLSNVGRPLPSTTGYIMDEFHNLLPIGVPGELYIGGDGVCQGYLNREELTQTRFIENPYHHGEIIYRSGDLLKLLENGEMEYLGRVDKQVKIRGFRIELREIEHQLAKIDYIKDAIVLDKEDKGGDKYLCAYLVSSQRIDPLTLKTKLSAILPHYMIPSYFVHINKVPLTNNGKIDTRNLPDPIIQVTDDYIAPTKDIEKEIVNIWAEVLNTDANAIGIKANFFEVGGNSIKLTKVKNKIKEELGTDVSIVSLFEHPTVKSLGFYLETLHSEVNTEEADVRIRENHLSMRKRRIMGDDNE